MLGSLPVDRTPYSQLGDIPHTHTQLLGDITSHPQLRRQHHQLAHVAWPVANSRSHTKNDFFLRKNTSQCMTFTVRLTGQHQAVQDTITHTNSAGGLCPVTNRGHSELLATIHSIPRGNVETTRNPTVKREVLISPQDRLAAYQERWYQDPLEQMKNTGQWTLW